MNVHRALSATFWAVACTSSANAVDGVTLINQASLNAAGGFYTITQPGSYRLSGNLDAPGTVCAQFPGDALSCAILVKAPNVTLDLNGFRIRTSGDRAVAILSATVDTTDLRVVNGSIVSNIPIAAFGLQLTLNGNLVLKDLQIQPVSAPAFYLGSNGTFQVQGVYAPQFDFLSGRGLCPALVTASVFRLIQGTCTSVGNSTLQ